MSLIHVLFLLFLVVPLVEIYVLLTVGGIIGALPTVGLVVFTAMLGAVLIRVQGIGTVLRIRESLDQGELPAVALIEGAALVLAGALLLTPGFVTDGIGFALLVPPLRRGLAERILASQVRPRGGPHPPGDGPGGRVIEGSFRRED